MNNFIYIKIIMINSKNGQIFYEHIWSDQYKGIINKIKENRDK